MLCYLATPIDQRNHDLQYEIARIKSRLIAEGFCIFDPSCAFSIGENTTSATFIRDINETVLTKYADVVFAVLKQGVPSVGVPMEIQQAQTLGIPCYVYMNFKSFHLDNRNQTMISDSLETLLKYMK